MGSEEWMSTQTTAYALLAIARLTGKFRDQKILTFEYTLNGKKGAYRTASRIAQIPVTLVGRVQGTVTVSNKSGQLLYSKLVMRGQPEVGDKTASQNNLQLEVTYTDMKGNPINPARIEQGTDFKAEVSILNPGMFGNYDQMALTQIFPSGWEIHNTRLNSENEGAAANSYQIPRYQDIRDDRVYSYFNIPAKQKVTYVVLLNASYMGRFYLPGISCEAMYITDKYMQEQEVRGWKWFHTRQNLKRSSLDERLVGVCASK